MEYHAVTEEDKLFIDLAWKMYNEQATQARQHETLRASSATLLFTLGGVVIGLGQFTKYSTEKPFINLFLIGMFLMIVSLLGFLIVHKHYDRNRMHVVRMRAYRKSIDQIFEKYNIRKISPIGSEASREYENENPFWAKIVRLNFLWGGAFILLFLIGMTFTIQFFISNGKCA